MLIHQIKVLQSNIGNETVQTVNARELHKALNNKRRFADWIKDRINDYGFVQNVDYVLISQNCETKGRGGDRRSIDYHITLDMAKSYPWWKRPKRQAGTPLFY